jgi:hypothetical protein
MGVKGSTSLPAEAILMVLGVLRVRVGDDSTPTASSMVGAVLILDVPRVAGFRAEKLSTSLVVEAILVVVGVLRVRVGGNSTSTAS